MKSYTLKNLQKVFGWNARRRVFGLWNAMVRAHVSRRAAEEAEGGQYQSREADGWMDGGHRRHQREIGIKIFYLDVRGKGVCIGYKGRNAAVL